MCRPSNTLVRCALQARLHFFFGYVSLSVKAAALQFTTAKADVSTLSMGYDRFGHQG